MDNVKINTERLHKFWILAAIGGLILGLRLIYIQIIKHNDYSIAADMNRTLVIYKDAPRGKIITSDNVVVAAGQPSFSLVYLPAEKKDEANLHKTSAYFASRLNMDEKAVYKNLALAFKKGAPVRVSEDLPLKSLFSFNELKTLYTGIELVKENKRYYPYDSFASHLIGYVSRMNEKEWMRLKLQGRYRLDSKVGKNGLEKRFEKYLKGEDGGLYLEVNSRGKLNKILKDRVGKPGADVYLTLDFKAQQAAEKGLENSKNKRGAVIAVNPKTGAILALANYPDFNPGVFAGRSSGNIKKFNEYNYAVKGLYEPASPFKIIVAAAALETEAVNPYKDKFFCPGYYKAGPRTFKCWEEEGHKSVNMIEAVTHSCDVYFYQLALKMGAAVIEKFTKKFHLGELTGIEMEGEKAGNIYGPRKRAANLSHWFIGDSLNLSIGQGELLTTPIQMLGVIAAVANGGKFWRPYYVDRVVSEGKIVFKGEPKLTNEIALKPQTWKVLKQSLLSVVKEGTGRLADIEGISVYGKTGTAQNPRGKDHAWFVAFAEDEKSKSQVAVCVFLEHGEHGYLAAPIARDVIKAAFRIEAV